MLSWDILGSASSRRRPTTPRPQVTCERDNSKTNVQNYASTGAVGFTLRLKMADLEVMKGQNYLNLLLSQKS